jgi:four helix bundle protein
MDYKELIFYQKAQEAVRAIDVLLKIWPKSMQAQEIGRQLFRAATSIGANIAEGHGRYIGQEYIRFLYIAQGSANEVDHWLRTALECKLGKPEEIQSIARLNNETRKMLKSTLYSLKNQLDTTTLRESPHPYSLIPSSLDDEVIPDDQ